MIQLIIDNVIILVPILLLSVLTVSIILERAFFYLRHKSLQDAVFYSAIDSLREGDIKPAQKAFRSTQDFLSRIFHLGIQLMRVQHTAPEAKLLSLSQESVYLLESKLNYLPQMANIATLIGLFGTVLGMIASFSLLKDSGSASPTALAGGIAQALTATAAGLVVAIPALIAHSVFLQHVEKLVKRMETLMAELVAFKEQHPHFLPGELDEE